MILVNDSQIRNTFTVEAHVLPTLSVKDTKDNEMLQLYVNGRDPIGWLSQTRTLLWIKPAPVVASFSSRGPNIVFPSILKVFHSHIVTLIPPSLFLLR